VELTVTLVRTAALALVGSLIVPVVTGLTSRLLPTPVIPGTPPVPPPAIWPYLVAAVAAIPCAVAVLAARRRVARALDGAFARQAEWLDTLPERWVDLAIVAAAAVSLFLELAVIRWQGTVFEFFAFYKNFSLLCCFAGLGLGYALAGRDRVPLAAVIPLLGWQFLALLAMRHGLPDTDLVSVSRMPFREQLTMGVGAVSSLAEGIATYLFLAVVFLLTALTFIPIGQAAGRLMRRRPNLRAYGLNLLGSLAGVAATTAVSFAWTPPVVWFALAGATVLALLPPAGVRAAGGVTLAAALAVLAWPVEPLWHTMYSPYQNLAVGFTPRGLMEIRAAGQYFQRVHDFTGNTTLRFDDLRIKSYYELPYMFFGTAPARVAVVGAGTGNDVAAAVRARAGHIDAIEIDPAILALGRAYHPERPYDQPEVRAIVADARTFLRNAPDAYDLIVYGLLDSHTLLSHASSVRLDSFVYTVEGLRDARARLSPDGALALSFSLVTPELGGKIQNMLAVAFDGVAPGCVQGDYDRSVTFFQTASPARRREVAPERLEALGFSDCSGRFASTTMTTDVSTDDWPFFYMPRRTYPASYLVMMALIVALSLALVSGFGRRPQASHTGYFLLGAGFMLVETKAITELGLTFGNTWLVIGVVIAGVLAMAFLANALVHWRGVGPVAVPYALLLASLVLGLVVAQRGGFASTPAGRLATVLLLTSPMFFSGLVFSSLIATEADLAGAMSANLFGAMCGGLLEYNAMYLGFQSLYVLAAGLYAGAFVFSTMVAPSLRALPSRP